MVLLLPLLWCFSYNISSCLSLQQISKRVIHYFSRARMQFYIGPQVESVVCSCQTGPCTVTHLDQTSIWFSLLKCSKIIAFIFILVSRPNSIICESPEATQIITDIEEMHGGGRWKTQSLYLPSSTCRLAVLLTHSMKLNWINQLAVGVDWSQYCARQKLCRWLDTEWHCPLHCQWHCVIWNCSLTDSISLCSAICI